MTKPEEGLEPESNGDHAQVSKSDDLLPEVEDGPWGYTPVFMTMWSGPFLASLGAFPNISDRCLEARIWHPKGILPTSLLRQEHARLLQTDPWLRELVCRIYLVDYKLEEGKYIYFIRIFVQLPTTCDQRLDTSDLAPRPLIEANNVRVNFDRCPTIDSHGVRGHAKGLVPKRLLDRLDGTLKLTERSKVGCFNKPEVEFHIWPRVRGFKIPTGFRPPHLEGLNAECLEALKDIVFWNAKAAERNLRDVSIPIRSPARSQRRGKPKRVTESQDSPDRRRHGLMFSNQVKIIPSDDDVLMSSPDGDLFAKVPPNYATESVTNTTHLNDTNPDTSTALVEDTESVTVKPVDIELAAVSLQDNTSVTADFADTESDKGNLLVLSRGKRIRSFLTRLFSCIPRCRRKNSK